MTTPPYDPNNPYGGSGQQGPGGYPQFPGGPPGMPPHGGYMPGGNPPPNHLVFAILSTLLCCWPLGIPAIVFAAQVNNKWSAGDYAGAHQASNRAKTFAIWSTVIGAISVLAVFALSFAGVINDVY